IAYDLWRRDTAASRIIAGLAAMPFVLPPIVLGVGLGFMWGFAGLLGQLSTGVLSHVALHLALPLVTISIGLNGIDRAHLDAAATMGATRRVIFRTVILPQTIAHTASGFFFAMVLSFNEFIVMFFVSSSSYPTVTLKIFSSLRNGFTPTMAVGAITFICASILVFAAVSKFGDLPRLMGAEQSRNH
ncbi:MAG: ABC transporter permease, partial [Gammaproteobacteria bacterium]